MEKIGYTAYSVTPENYYEVEAELNTDFASMELDPECSYIVIIGSDENGAGVAKEGVISPVYDVLSSFSYTYNGTTYAMRTLMVTADDDSSYGKASTVNVLTSASKTVITNCLNTAITAYLDAIASPLGTIASICGLDVSNFSTSQSSTLNLNAGTNWTRKYTQVKNSSTGVWVNGSSVEYVTCKSYMSGLYYSASTNQYEQVPGNTKSTTTYSEYYNNATWRNQKAAIGYENLTVIYDTLSTVQYKYGSTTKITHTFG